MSLFTDTTSATSDCRADGSSGGIVGLVPCDGGTLKVRQAVTQTEPSRVVAGTGMGVLPDYGVRGASSKAPTSRGGLPISLFDTIPESGEYLVFLASRAVRGKDPLVAGSWVH